MTRTAEGDRRTLAAMLVRLAEDDANEVATSTAMVLASTRLYEDSNPLHDLVNAVSKITGVPSVLGVIETSMCAGIGVVRQLGLELPDIFIPYANN